MSQDFSSNTHQYLPILAIQTSQALFIAGTFTLLDTGLWAWLISVVILAIGLAMSIQRANTREDSQQTSRINLSEPIPDYLDDQVRNTLAQCQKTLRGSERGIEATNLDIEEFKLLLQQLLVGAQDQLNRAHSSAESVNHLNQQIQSTCDQAAEVNTAVSQAQQLSSNSAETVEHISNSISESASHIRNLAGDLESLKASIEKIANISTEVKSIADQTNLLALNAAIEAARAGDQGRGFSVVADEVRNLALRTTEATNEISDLIKAVTDKTSGAVNAMSITREQILSVTEQSDTTRAQILNVSEHMQQLSAVASAIAESTEQQLAASTDISNNGIRLEHLSRSNQKALDQAQSTVSKTASRSNTLLNSYRELELADIDVVHGWKTAGDGRAVSALKKLLNENNHHWADRDDTADIIQEVDNKIRRGNPPSAAAIAGVKIQNWAGKQVLADLSDVANEQNWQQVLPSALKDLAYVDGKPTATILNVARVDVCWVNLELLKQAGYQRPPVSWEEFFSLCDRLKDQGITPIAHSEEAWQVATVFEAVALSVAGAQWFAQAFNQHSSSQAFKDSKFAQVINTFRRLKPYCSVDNLGRDFSLVSADIISGKAAIQIMGDWTRGELEAGGMVLGKDYDFWPTPSQKGEFSFAADTLLMFKQSDPTRHRAQLALARTAMSLEGQKAYNLQKGSVPSRTDFNASELGDYVVQTHKEFLQAAQNKTLVASAIHNMALQNSQKEALIDAIYRVWKEQNLSTEAASSLMEQALSQR